MEVVDAFFALKAPFNCLVMDRYNPGLYRGEDEELDYYKSLFWLIRKRVRLNTQYRVVLDDRTNHNNDRLTTLRDCLNNAARKDQGYAHRRTCFSEVVPADSEKEPLLQVADLLLGAICYHMNKAHRAPNASPAKCALAEYLAYRGGFGLHVLTPTSPFTGPINVWLWRSRG
jgi:hypothetical protein